MSGNEKEGLDASDSDFDPSDEDGEAADAETETEAEQPADDAAEATEAEPTDDDTEAEQVLKSILEDDEEVDIVRETAARALGATGEEVEELVDQTGGTEMAGDHMLNQVPDR